jgi:hypothetical protein
VREERAHVEPADLRLPVHFGDGIVDVDRSPFTTTASWPEPPLPVGQ